MEYKYSHLQLALREYGTHGILGAKHNNKIIDYFKIAGHPQIKSDEVAWCAAFLSYILNTATGSKFNYLAARQFLNIGKETKKPELGDIVVFWRDDPKSWKGHVGIYISENEKEIFCLGGNQKNTVDISKFLKSNVLQFRKLSN